MKKIYAAALLAVLSTTSYAMEESDDFQAQTLMGNLPPEVQEIIGQHLTVKDIISYGSTSREGRDLVQPCLASGLTSLNLSNANIGYAGTKAIANSPTLLNLTSLSLRHNKIWDEEAIAIAKSPTLTKLRFLDLGNDGKWCRMIDTPGYNPWSRHLTGLSMYTEVYGIGEKGAKAIANSPTLTNLTSLNLEHNTIWDGGAIAIANSPTLLNLTSLNLSHANIGNAGAMAIAKSQNLASLTSLNLAHNQIGDEGIMAILESPFLTNLKSLILD